LTTKEALAGESQMLESFSPSSPFFSEEIKIEIERNKEIRDLGQIQIYA
jgi:hypothetical protein